MTLNTVIHTVRIRAVVLTTTGFSKFNNWTFYYWHQFVSSSDESTNVVVRHEKRSYGMYGLFVLGVLSPVGFRDGLSSIASKPDQIRSGESISHHSSIFCYWLNIRSGQNIDKSDHQLPRQKDYVPHKCQSGTFAHKSISHGQNTFCSSTHLWDSILKWS